jgi:AcrR family transcriptional regulator
MSPIAKLAIRREPKQQRSSEMVAKVCTVTLALVRERGLRNINTNLIAQEAGVDISSLYRFFANKEAILYHIAQEWLADIREVYDRYEQEPALLALIGDQTNRLTPTTPMPSISSARMARPRSPSIGIPSKNTVFKNVHESLLPASSNLTWQSLSVSTALSAID